MKAPDVINSIKRLLKSILPKGAEAILYGSRARGDAHDDSDWDVLVILDKSKLEMSDYMQFSYPLTVLGCDIGEEIRPMLYTKSDWESYSLTPFYENVIHDGIKL